jgi:hypothetical protein
MPVKIRKVSKQKLFKVTNPNTGHTFSKATTLEMAERQQRKLGMLKRLQYK